MAWGLRHDTRLISIKIWGSILDARRKLILVRGSSLVTGKCVAKLGHWSLTFGILN